MNRTLDHYESLLAEHYTWMLGDFDARVRDATSSFRAAGLIATNAQRAIDLGAGSGCHTLALAALGYQVHALDFSPRLITELRERAAGLPVKATVADLLDPAKWPVVPAHVITCMGDTLTHLESPDAVRALLLLARSNLVRGGRLILSYRDLSESRLGLERFIPVRADDRRILTCFLEYGAERVQVHDLLYVREGDGWKLRKSSYPKLRLPRATLFAYLSEAGFDVVRVSDDRGMTEIVAVPATVTAPPGSGSVRPPPAR